MSAFKRINTSDSFVVPYTANKSWNIPSESLADYQITINIGVKDSTSVFNSTNDLKTNGQYDRLVYDSINTTYYPSFLPKFVNTSSKISTIQNDGTLSTSSYYNGFIELGNLDTVKYFPTGENSIIYTINFPRQITGDKILPTTLAINYESGSFYDDGNYNLFYSGSTVSSSAGMMVSQSMQVGNVFYEQNIAVLSIIPQGFMPTPTPTPTSTPIPTSTPTSTPTNTPTPTSTPIPPTPTPTSTPTPTPTASLYDVTVYASYADIDDSLSSNISYSLDGVTYNGLGVLNTGGLYSCDNIGTITGITSGTTFYVYVDRGPFNKLPFMADPAASCVVTSITQYCGPTTPYSVAITANTSISLAVSSSIVC